MKAEVMNGQNETGISPVDCLDKDHVVTSDTNGSRRIQQSNLLVYLVLGILFGIVLIKSEVISWFRIQEMFRFESFHMYGIIGVAVVFSALIVFLMKRSKMKLMNGQTLSFQPMKLSPKRHLLAGSIFGLGWALIGACPGPMYVLLGHGYWIIGLVILGALLGTYSYGAIRHRLPH